MNKVANGLFLHPGSVVILKNNHIISKGRAPMNNDTMELITVDELCEALMIGKNAACCLLAEGKILGFPVHAFHVFFLSMPH